MTAAARLSQQPNAAEPAPAPPPVAAAAHAPVMRAHLPARSSVLSPTSVQAKGFISSPEDASEHEADRIAAHVVSMPYPAPQASGASGGAARSVMRNPLIPQRAPAAAPSNANDNAAVMAEIKAAASGGFALPRKTRAFLEPRFRADFSGVMLHTDATAKRLSNKIGARAFTYGRHIFFNTGQYNPDSTEGLRLLAHELTHTIQQSETVQRKAIVHERVAPQVQRIGNPFAAVANAVGGAVDALGEAVGNVLQIVKDYAADHAESLGGFRILCLVLGHNPINDAPAPGGGRAILRELAGFIPFGDKVYEALNNHGIIDKGGAFIDTQIVNFRALANAIIGAIRSFFGSLGPGDALNPLGAWNRLRSSFTPVIDSMKNFASGLVSGFIELVREVILKPMARWAAANIPHWDLLMGVLGVNPVSNDGESPTMQLIGAFMRLIGQEEVWDNIQRGGAIGRAWAWFQTAMSGARDMVSGIPDEVIATIRSFTITDVLTVVGAAGKILGLFASIGGKFIRWAGGTVIELLKIVIDVVAPGVTVYLQRAAGAFQTIVRNPVGFVGNLVRAAMQGFRQFAANFLTHLQASLVGWLTGALGGTGVYIPQGLNLREILKFVLSVLGLTWANIRQKLVTATNETTVVALETGFEIVRTLVTEGPAAAWQQILETLSNLQQMAIDAIMNFVQQRVVQAAVTRLLSMLTPAGAFIQAVIAIYNTIMFFVERLRQIAAVAASFIDAIAAIAAGNIGPAANRVETTMAGLLTMVISFLARIAGLGRVADAVTGLIQRVRAPIDRALDRVVAWIVAQARRLGRFILQAGVPADPNARLRLAIRDARVVARALGNRISRPLLERGIEILRTRYSLTALRVTERNGRFLVFASINPMLEEEVAQALGASSVDVERLIAGVADGMMADPRVVRERDRILRAHRGPAGIAAAGQRGDDTVIPTIAVGPGPGFLGAAGALQDANRPARFNPQSPHEFMTMPFRPGVSGERQATRGPGGVIVGGGVEDGQRVRVSYPELVRRYRAIANAQTPPIGDAQMMSAIANYIRSGAMPPPFDQGVNANFLAEVGRIVGSVEVARSGSAAVELSMLTRLVQTGTLSFDQAFDRDSAVNPMTMRGAARAARERQTELQAGARPPEGGEFAGRRRQLIITYALQEIRSRGLTFATPADVQRWAQTDLIAIIQRRAQELFGLQAQSN